MSKNPKVTIALAFVLTFLIGFGGGYMLCGNVNPHAGSRSYYPEFDPAEEDRIAPEPATVPATDDAAAQYEDENQVAPRRMERRAGERAAESVQTAESARTTDADGASDRNGYRANTGYRTENGRRAVEASETGSPVLAAMDEPTGEETARDDASEQDYRTHTEERTGERRFRRTNADADTSVERPADYRERDRQWGPDSDRSPFSRYRNRLIRDLSLTEDNAEMFFSLLEEHRRQVREEIIIPQRELRERHHELSEQLEQNLSGLLSEEQMEVWKERYSPRMDRSQRRPSSGDEE